MKITPCYSEEIGRYLEFVPECARDKKSLREFANELISAGTRFYSISVHNRIVSVKVPCKLFGKESKERCDVLS